MNRNEPNKRPTATQLLDLINNLVQKEVNIFINYKILENLNKHLLLKENRFKYD